MAGPRMVGDPTPIDREALRMSLEEAVPRMHSDAQKLLSEAELSGDKAQIRDAQKLFKKTQKLVGELRR
jgi:hypothetical protein